MPLQTLSLNFNQLKLLGYRQIDVPKFGNCLFEAIEYLLHGDIRGRQKAIRDAVCEELSKEEVWDALGFECELAFCMSIREGEDSDLPKGVWRVMHGLSCN